MKLLVYFIRAVGWIILNVAIYLGVWLVHTWTHNEHVKRIGVPELQITPLPIQILSGAILVMLSVNLFMLGTLMICCKEKFLEETTLPKDTRGEVLSGELDHWESLDESPDHHIHRTIRGGRKRFFAKKSP